MVPPYHGTPLSNKKEQSINTCNNLDKSQGHYIEWGKEVNLKKLHMPDSIHMTFFFSPFFCVGVFILVFFFFNFYTTFLK